jgi:hypothetical protein
MKLNNMNAIVSISILIILVVGILAIATMFAWFSVDTYFMCFKFEKHPKLIAMLDSVAHEICDEEGIGVFNKSYAEVNKDKPKGEEAVGMYIYTLDEEYQQKVNKNYKEIRDLEEKYGMSYERICRVVGVDSTTTAEDFILPKILLCKDSLLKWGWSSYYSTFFHEIGHHFAAKELGKHTEEDADRYAYKIIKERLPIYFQLFYGWHFEYKLKVSMKRKDIVIAHISYLQYLIEKNYDNFKLKFV